MKTERLLGIILLLQSRKTLTAEKLAEIFEVSPRTIYRDINSLCLAKVPIVSLPGPEGGYSLMEGYRIDPTLFTTDEAVSLFMGGSVIEQVDPTAKIKNALIKIESVLPEAYKEEISRTKETILFDMTSWFGKKDERYLDLLRQAVTEKRQAEILYPSHCQLIQEKRKIDPYGLICKAGVWYLAAFCHLRDDFRTFRVDRIRGVKVLDNKFTPSEGFDIGQYWKQAVKGYEQRKGEYPVKIKIDKKMAGIVRRYIWGGELITNAKDGSLIWQMEADSLEYATSFALSLGQHAEVLEPDELRKKVIKEAEKIIRRYKN